MTPPFLWYPPLGQDAAISRYSKPCAVTCCESSVDGSVRSTGEACGAARFAFAQVGKRERTERPRIARRPCATRMLPTQQPTLLPPFLPASLPSGHASSR